MSNSVDKIPTYNPFSVDDAVVYESDKGPWSTKSGGQMHVIMAFDEAILKLLLVTEPEELLYAPKVKLGFRAFHTKGIEAKTEGGKHYHRIKREFICASNGALEFLLEDVYGGKKIIILDQNTRALYIPPFVMHSYKVLKQAELIGISNTLYDHEDPETHDTYDRDAFNRLVSKYSNNTKNQ